MANSDTQRPLRFDIVGRAVLTAVVMATGACAAGATLERASSTQVDRFFVIGEGKGVR